MLIGRAVEQSSARRFFEQLEENWRRIGIMMIFPGGGETISNNCCFPPPLAVHRRKLHRAVSCPPESFPTMRYRRI